MNTLTYLYDLCMYVAGAVGGFAVFSLVLVAAAALLVWMPRALWRLRVALRKRAGKRAAASPDKRTCERCGYDLGGLEFPRCPECGALAGFRVPLESLGLSEHEIRAGFDERRRLRSSENAAPRGRNPTDRP